MTIMSEGLPQKLKCLKMGREEGFSSFPHTATSCNCLPCGSESFDGYLFTITTLQT